MQTLLPRLGVSDIAQIIVLSAVALFLLQRLAGLRALRLFGVMLLVAVVYLLAQALDLRLVRSVLAYVLQYGIIVAIVIFQPELRSLVMRLGRHRAVRFLTRVEENEVADEIAEAIERLARAKIGAIIAIEGDVGLQEYAETGSAIQARVAADIIVSMFLPYAPLHDGALLVSGDTIIGAGVILPLTQQAIPDRTLGTRHRAALGLSEETDALVIVVSEETQQIALARRGRLDRDVEIERVRAALMLMAGEDSQAPTQ
jgi:diadenylate cyclase